MQNERKANSNGLRLLLTFEHVKIHSKSLRVDGDNGEISQQSFPPLKALSFENEIVSCFYNLF